MEFRYPFARIVQGAAFWVLLGVALLWWLGGTAAGIAAAWVALPALMNEFRRWRQRIRVDTDGLTVGDTTLPWIAIQRVRMGGWGFFRYVEFHAEEKRVTVSTALEDYDFFATLVQQWLPPEAERPPTLLA